MLETMEQEAENRKYWDQLPRVRGVMQRMLDQQSEPSEMPVKESMQRTLRKRSGEVFVSMKQLRGLAVPIGKHQHLHHLPLQLHRLPHCRTLLTLRRSTTLCLLPIGGWWRIYSHHLNAQSAWKPSERRRCHAAEVVISSAAFVCSELSCAQPAEPQCRWPVVKDV